MMHVPVLLDDALTALAIQPDGIYIDATLGRGGHSQAILARLSEQGRLLAFDRDPEALAHGQQLFAKDKRVTLIDSSFVALRQQAHTHGVLGQVNGILWDLGVSSPQLDDPQRGFSFLNEGPLDMRMDPRQGISAAEWLNTASEADIARVIRSFGEERYARRIARAVIAARVEQPLATTKAFAELVAEAVPTREKHKHPATRTFQALRIFINGELDALADSLQQSLDVLAVGGRLVVISFHSLEDRIVKQFIQRWSRADVLPTEIPVKHTEYQQARLRRMGKHVMPSKDEITKNPRARSAKLRIAEKLQ